jgi:hypothetical protein
MQIHRVSFFEMVEWILAAVFERRVIRYMPRRQQLPAIVREDNAGGCPTAALNGAGPRRYRRPDHEQRLTGNRRGDGKQEQTKRSHCPTIT